MKKIIIILVFAAFNSYSQEYKNEKFYIATKDKTFDGKVVQEDDNGKYIWRKVEVGGSGNSNIEPSAQSKSVMDCSKITKQIDKFDGKVTYLSPYKEPVSFMMTISGNDTTMFMALTTYGATLNNSKGIIVLLSGGEKLEYPNGKIDYRSGPGSTWEYSGFVKLSDEDIVKLRANNITDFRLYIYEASLKEKDQKRIHDYFLCMINNK